MKFEKYYDVKIKKMSIGDKVEIKRVRIGSSSNKDEVLSSNEKYVGEVGTIISEDINENGFDYYVEFDKKHLLTVGVFEEDVKKVKNI